MPRSFPSPPATKQKQKRSRRPSRRFADGDDDDDITRAESTRPVALRVFHTIAFYACVRVSKGGAALRSRVYHGLIVRRYAHERPPTLREIDALSRADQRITGAFRLVSATAYELPARHNADVSAHRRQLRQAELQKVRDAGRVSSLGIFYLPGVGNENKS